MPLTGFGVQFTINSPFTYLIIYGATAKNV